MKLEHRNMCVLIFKNYNVNIKLKRDDIMSRISENAYARKYYRTHDKYRKKKIQDRKDYASSHKKEEASQSRKYYHETPSYRRYKIKYAQSYQRTHRTRKRK